MTEKNTNLETKKSEYLTLINKIFPELSVSSSFSMYNGEYPISAKIELSNQVLAFKNKFKYSGNFIHYTNLDSLMNIMNSQEVRLYNCQNLNDKLELKYAVKELGIEITDDELQLQRQNFFIFSAAEYDLQECDDDFNLWRLYSNSGLGAAIVFEIENIDANWYNIFYGKVNYGVEINKNNDFLNFIKVHQEFNKKNKLFENIPSIIPAIGLHFKNKIWSIENEIRFIAHCPFDKYSLEAINFEGGNPYLLSTLKHTINKFGNRAAYVTLPLNIDKIRAEYKKIIGEEDTENYLKCIPHLKIKRIIIGHKVSGDTFWAIEKILSESFSKILGYSIEIGYSSFKDSD